MVLCQAAEEFFEDSLYDLVAGCQKRHISLKTMLKLPDGEFQTQEKLFCRRVDILVQKLRAHCVRDRLFEVDRFLPGELPLEAKKAIQEGNYKAEGRDGGSLDLMDLGCAIPSA